jgi:hypothetical protein
VRRSPTGTSSAVEHYVEHGAAEAARQTGIKETTIRSWANRAHMTGTRSEHAARAQRASSAAWAQRRSRLGEAFGEDAELVRGLYLDALDAGRISEARTLLITCAVLCDNFASGTAPISRCRVNAIDTANAVRTAPVLVGVTSARTALAGTMASAVAACI